MTAEAASTIERPSTTRMFRQTHHIIAISHPSHPHFLACILHLRDSLFIWVGESSHAAAEEALKLSNGTKPSSNTLQNFDESESARAGMSEEEQRQEEVDRQMDEELSKALEEAGRRGAEVELGSREDDQSSHRLQGGALANEWAVAMWKAGQPARGTSLFRTSQDIAEPMCRRLARRLNIPQLHLSLSLPPAMLPEGNMPAPPGANQAVLSLEEGIECAVRESRGQRQESVAKNTSIHMF